MILLFLAFLQASSIQGVVVRAGTTEPVAKAAVALRKAGSSGSETVITGSDGRFSFQSIPAGRYGLTATRIGFLNTAYQQRGVNRPGVPLTINAGQQFSVKLSMTPTAAISGRVTDMDGDPLPNVAVQALK